MNKQFSRRQVVTMLSATAAAVVTVPAFAQIALPKLEFIKSARALTANVHSSQAWLAEKILRDIVKPDAVTPPSGEWVLDFAEKSKFTTQFIAQTDQAQLLLKENPERALAILADVCADVQKEECGTFLDIVSKDPNAYIAEESKPALAKMYVRRPIITSRSKAIILNRAARFQATAGEEVSAQRNWAAALHELRFAQASCV